MTSTLAAAEKEKYDSMWAMNGYRNTAPGQHYVPPFIEMAQPKLSGLIQPTLLDAGCGSGLGALALAERGFKVTMIDLSDEGLVDEAKTLPFYHACLWNDLSTQVPYRWGGKFDYVYCCDVLEHIAAPLTMLVIHRLLSIARLGLFLSISTKPDEFGHVIGTPLHQTVLSFVQWRDLLREMGTVVEARDVLHSGLYWMTPNA